MPNYESIFVAHPRPCQATQSRSTQCNSSRNHRNSKSIIDLGTSELIRPKLFAVGAISSNEHITATTGTRLPREDAFGVASYIKTLGRRAYAKTPVVSGRTDLLSPKRISVRIIFANIGILESGAGYNTRSIRDNEDVDANCACAISPIIAFRSKYPGPNPIASRVVFANERIAQTGLWTVPRPAAPDLG